VPTRRALAVRAAYVCVVAAAILVPAACGALARAAGRGRAAGRRHLSRRLVHLVTRLGPTFVKAGQVLGTRRDVLPGELCDELSVLQDSVPPLRPSETARALREAYDDPGAVFADFDEEAVASGSVACVYRARLHSGREVAVKLRRPDVERLMTLDVTVIQRVAALMARLPVMRDLPVNDVLRHMGDAVLGQLDFAREAASLRRLRANLAVVPRVWVPRVHLEESRPRCIVMEFIPGLEVDSARRQTPAARRRFAASGLTSIYQMLFVDGFVHCDMHPGNLYFTERAHVVVLDAGFSVQLTERLRRLFAEFFMNMSIGRGERCADIVLESAEGLRDNADPAGFRVRMAALVRRNHKVPAKDFSLMAFATEMFDLQRRFGVHAAPELIFPLLSLLVIEGTVRDLDPDVDFQETAKPVLMRGLFGQRTAA
jgi:ubiquinone biosynthesis protein